jgi:uncharacterized membrane protein
MHALYPLGLASLLFCALLTGRLYFDREWGWLFLGWNLFLAWVPYLISLWLATLKQEQRPRWLFGLIIGLVWLAFLPNAPYLVTDLIHLRPREPIPYWYDLGLFAVLAWTGLFLAVFSLRVMQSLVEGWLGRWPGWLFVLGTVSITGLGVYIGRFLRWNSWDLLTHPHLIVSEITARLANPLEHPGSVGFTFIMAMLLLIAYLTITTTSLRESSQK